MIIEHVRFVLKVKLFYMVLYSEVKMWVTMTMLKVGNLDIVESGFFVGVLFLFIFYFWKKAISMALIFQWVKAKWF